MAEIKTGANGRTDVGWTSRSTANVKDDAKFSKIITAGPTNTITFFTTTFEKLSLTKT